MPPDTQSSTSSRSKESRDKEGPQQRIGNYMMGKEIGRGSFATVYKGYHLKSRQLIAVKAVSRQKLTSKLLENLESEINILKVIHHRNIVGLEDCFKNDTHIYLVMEYCSGGDLSVYLKKGGRLATLDFMPRPGEMLDAPRSEGGKVWWPHPATGALDERVTRSFVGQLAKALKFLRSQNLMHRDLKPQNLLLQPATAAEVDDGHPYGIPVLKVADFGFARILPAAAMAETLCGSPLYMAPEILRYEKYDATADLWSVGAIFYEMAVGRPCFRANNHVELLRRIEKADDRIVFPDEERVKEGAIPPIPVADDMKALIRRLLKRKAVDRIGFEEFFASSVWDVRLTESVRSVQDGSTEEEGSLSLEVSTGSSSADAGEAMGQRVKDMVASADRQKDRVEVKRRAPMPLSTEDKALNPQRAVARPAVQPARPVRRSEPKYYVDDDDPALLADDKPPTPQSAPTPTPSKTGPQPRPIVTSAQRRMSSRSGAEAASVEDPQPVTPSSNPPVVRRGIGEGSPLAATPPITMDTGKDQSALDEGDSVVGREYVVVEKRTVEINKLADELEQASRKPAAVVRRPSSRTSVVSRPISAFKPVAVPQASATTSSPTSPVSSPTPAQQAVTGPVSYSPPFALSATPPFAIPPTPSAARAVSSPIIPRPPSIPQSLNIFPPTQLAYTPDSLPRYTGTSPSSLQTGALARALTNTAIRLIGTGANTAANAIARAANRRRPAFLRTTAALDPAQDELLSQLEDLARKAFVLYELADQRLLYWQSLSRPPVGAGMTGSQRRKSSSSSSVNSEVLALRQQETVAGEAVSLYYKGLRCIAEGMGKVKGWWEKAGVEEGEASQELNDVVQWLRSRFNEVYEKAEWAKLRCADEIPFVDKLLHDKAREMSRHAALAELSGDFATAETGYENALWMLTAMLDDVIMDEGRLRGEDRMGVEKLIVPLKLRLEALHKKMDGSQVPVKEAIYT